MTQRTASRLSLSDLQGLVGGTWALDWAVNGELVGFAARIVNVGEERVETGEQHPDGDPIVKRTLYVDTDDGYRYDLPDGPVNVEAWDVTAASLPQLDSDEAGTEVGGITDSEPAEVLAQVADTKDVERALAADDAIFSFVCGTAGTGKTYMQVALAHADPSRKLCATTGIAAVNLGEGVTINALLHYKDTSDLQVEYELGRLHAALNRLAESGYTTIVLDEVSMLDARALDILVLAIDEQNAKRLTRDDEPIRLVLVGDFAQLPPVKAPFAFQAQAWNRFQEHTTRLTEPKRQGDRHFVRALQAVRRGDTRLAMEYFEGRITNKETQRFDGTTILAKNDEVDRYNRLRLMDLHTDEVTFTSVRAGEQASEWTKHIPPQLALKRGALVMILSNRREPIPGQDPMTWPMVHANGDLGTLEDWMFHDVQIPDPLHKPAKPSDLAPEDDPDWPLIKITRAIATVKLHRKDKHGMEQTVQVSHVHREKGEATGHKGKRAARDSITGWIDYLPLRVAYATTCHKSQGLSLDNVQIMFHSWFWNTPGMLYVALSRARTPGGLHLVGTPQQFLARIKVDPKVRPWL